MFNYKESSIRLACENLTISYRRHPAIHHLNCEFAIGDTTAIIGPNGAGKSTILKAILGELKPDTGSIIRQNLSTKDIAYLPQHSEIDNSIPLSINDVVMLGNWNNMGLFKSCAKSAQFLVDKALDSVGLSGFNNRYVAELSRGQLQRVLFARTIVQDAKVIMLDEPFNAMDSKTVDSLLDVITHWKQQNKTVIAVLHDLHQVNVAFNYTMLIATNLIGHGKTNEIVTRDNLAIAYKHNFNWMNDDILCNKD